MSNKYLLNLTATCAILMLIAGLIATWLLFPMPGAGGEVTPDYTYSVSSYRSDITVNEDNTAKVTDTLTVDFVDPGKHGIIYVLPLVSTVVIEDEDGRRTSEKYRLKYSDINATMLHSSYSENDNLCLMLGDPNSFAQERMNFTVEYTMHLGDDRHGDFDQFYFNIIGNNWDTQISNVAVNIKFPKAIQNEFWVYPGNREPVTVVPTEDNTKISFTYNGTLNAGEAFTVRTVLPQGYFNVHKSYLKDILLLVAAVLAVIVFIIMFRRRNNKNQIVPVVEFGEPEGINSAEAGYIIDEKVDKKDVTSLIVYWAQHGYLKIIEDDKGDLSLERVKPADDGMKDYEQALFDKIFESGEKVTLDSIKYSLALQINTAAMRIRDTHEEKTFSTAATVARVTFALIPVILIALAGFLSAYVIVSFSAALYTVFAATAWLAALMLLVYLGTKRLTLSSGKVKAYFTLWVIITLAISIGYVWIGFSVYADPFMMKIIAVLMGYLSAVLIWKINIRTNPGNMVTGRLLGLRKFIEVAEKSRIEMLVKEDPQAFFRVLPYAYVLGVSDTWIKKFNDISLEQPDFYVSSSPIAPLMIASHMNHCFFAIQTAMLVTPKVDIPNIGNIGSGGLGGGFGGGGFGGGFSGGGFGGSGGRSW